MKFILEEASKSFQSNVRELDERGLFDPPQAGLYQRRGEIEKLFQEARQNHSLRQVLGRKLKEYHLFEDYQDRFLSLFRDN